MRWNTPTTNSVATKNIQSNTKNKIDIQMLEIDPIDNSFIFHLFEFGYSYVQKLSLPHECLVTGKNYKSLLAVIGGLWLSGKTPILCNQWSKADPSIPSINADLVSIDQDLPAMPKSKTEYLKILEPQAISFFSSGTTGEPKLITKSLHLLFKEVAVLNGIFKLHQESLIYSTVNPSHMFGFLFTFLLPIFSGSKILFADPSTHLFETIPDIKIDLFVCVPATWRLTKLFFPKEVSNFVSSGAMIGHDKETEFLQAQKPYNPQFFELLGSTETGGIGFRIVGKNLNTEFVTLNGVKLKECSNHTLVNSPFLENNPQQLMDKIITIDDSKFLFKGRSDRIIKYASTRISLTQLETALKKVYPVQSILCDFEEHENLPKGGILTAYLESPEKNFNHREMRLKYTALFDLPFPHRILLIEKFPTNPLGKVLISELKKLNHVS